MWNGTQQPQQQQSQYASQLSTRLDFPNQMQQQQQQQQQQRLPPRQSSPSSSHYSQSITNSNSTNNPNSNTYSSNSTVTNNDRWMNLPWTDPAIISFGNKLDPTSSSSASSQWSTTTQSQGSSTLSSGTNLIPSMPRWSQHPSTQTQSHMISNGIYSPYSTTSGVDDGNRS